MRPPLVDNVSCPMAARKLVRKLSWVGRKEQSLAVWSSGMILNFCFLACIAVGLRNNDAHATTDTVSERLRRWTRNPLGSARRGSNPLGVDILFLHLLC